MTTTNTPRLLSPMQPGDVPQLGGDRAVSAVRRDGAPRGPIIRWSSAQLLQGQRQVELEHAGQVYRLSLTAQGKLILTK
ncbi:hemin uptake protein HemP [Paucibacter sp. APW11]|uniref:Hemin uptake protein HemP n=1 Tax=Roseateles aquae TaxID=3077235 RepID=A0ABU3P7Y9_9BURK|nr:hemin uptake protein HemP [Paucibacter sp. APW11]MDT8998608.1 hemin uptake protein HemP [Paucibacter sp. APW11]